MSEHRPIELSINPPECCAETCDHAAGQHPIGMTVACEACTFAGVDVGMDAVIVPQPWPCEHGRPGKANPSPESVDALIASLRKSGRAS